MFGLFCRARETRKGRPNVVAEAGDMPATALHSTSLDTPVTCSPAHGARSRDVSPNGGSVRKLLARHQPTPKTEHYKLIAMSMTTPSSSPATLVLRDSTAAD